MQNKFYMHLVELIDITAEDLFLPAYLTQHLKSGYWDPNRKTRREFQKKQPKFNRKCLLQLLLIALSDREPVNLEFEYIQIEIARLSQIGQQVITLACVISMIFSGGTLQTEKDYDAHKNQITSKENLKQQAEKFGLQFFKIKSKQPIDSRSKVQENQIKNEQIKESDLADIVQALAGYFAIYIGFNAALLFLVDLGILQSQLNLEVGDSKKSINQKVEILKQISNNRRQLISENDKINMFQKKLVKLIRDHAGLQIMSPSSLNITSCEQNSSPKFDRNFSLIKLLVKNAAESLRHSNLATLQQNIELHDHLLDSKDSLKEKAFTKPDSNEKNAMENDGKINYPSPLYDCDLEEQSNNTSFTQEKEKEESMEEAKCFSYPYEVKKIFKFKNKHLLLQPFVHSSSSVKLKNKLDEIDEIAADKSDYSKIIAEFNYQILEYLGDPFLNFTISKLFYLETAEQQQKWHSNYFPCSKLHDLTSWFSSNKWLAFVIYENFFFTLLTDKSDRFKREKESLINLIKEVRNMKYLSDNDAKLIQLLERGPKLPLLYDEQNLGHRQKIIEFSNKLFKFCCFQCPDKYLNSENLSRFDQDICNLTQEQSSCASTQSSFHEENVNLRKPQEEVFKPLSLSSFTQNYRIQEEDEEFDGILQHFVKFFSDSIEALIGAIFLDSGDFEKAQVLTLRLIGTTLKTTFPIKKDQQAMVLAIWNSKKYTQGIKLSHLIEEQGDNHKIRGYMNNMEVRRVKFKFPKDQKNKIFKFYKDFQQYLEQSYSIFEEYHIKIQSPEVEALHFFQFNQDFKNTLKNSSQAVSEGNQCSIVKEASRRLFLKYKDDERKQLGFNDIDQIKQELEEVLSQGLKDAKYDVDKLSSQVLILELERVRIPMIREFFNRCKIKSINTTAKGVKTLKDFITRLPDKHAFYLYYQLFQLAEELIEETENRQKSKEKRDNNSNSNLE